MARICCRKFSPIRASVSSDTNAEELSPSRGKSLGGAATDGVPLNSVQKAPAASQLLLKLREREIEEEVDDAALSAVGVGDIGWWLELRVNWTIMKGTRTKRKVPPNPTNVEPESAGTAVNGVALVLRSGSPLRH